MVNSETKTFPFEELLEGIVNTAVVLLCKGKLKENKEYLKLLEKYKEEKDYKRFLILSRCLVDWESLEKMRDKNALICSEKTSLVDENIKKLKEEGYGITAIVEKLCNEYSIKTAPEAKENCNEVLKNEYKMAV